MAYDQMSQFVVPCQEQAIEIYEINNKENLRVKMSELKCHAETKKFFHTKCNQFNWTLFKMIE